MESNNQIVFRWKSDHSRIESYRESYKKTYEEWLCYHDNSHMWERFAQPLSK